MELAHRAHWAIKTVNADYDEAGKLRKLQLSEIEEIRDEAYECASAYKDKLKKVHDAKLRKKTFEVGQKVWLYNSQLKMFAGKLKSKWMGPYVIRRVGQFGDVDIQDEQTLKQQTIGHYGKTLLNYGEISGSVFTVNYGHTEMAKTKEQAGSSSSSSKGKGKQKEQPP
ncbi:uncharacterized protein LOC110943390 [Helianthus annuus]|uniref:uncharacterized protein LOC110943390 n=1 Tax=Helianthus annuus TaxID=4232 RepID=UPI000B8F8EFC|nr:uncharacterized protein LOC110943390 [Helianthus annuus]